MWSEELQKQTKEHLEKLPAASMKHFGDSRYGLCLFKNEKFVISEFETNEKHEFESIDELIEDGWAID